MGESNNGQGVPLTDLPLTTRTKNVLSHHGIRWGYELGRMSERDLRKVYGLGKKGREEVVAWALTEATPSDTPSLSFRALEAVRAEEDCGAVQAAVQSLDGRLRIMGLLTPEMGWRLKDLSAYVAGISATLSAVVLNEQQELVDSAQRTKRDTTPRARRACASSRTATEPEDERQMVFRFQSPPTS